jgi:AAA+ superfamily predicted ATPase
MDVSFETIIHTKIIKLKEIIKNSINSNQLNKKLDFIESNDLNSCIDYAEGIYDSLSDLSNYVNTLSQDETIDKLQSIINKISTLISLYGCDNLDDLIYICISSQYKLESRYKKRYNTLNMYIHPLRYKILEWKSKVKSNEETIFKNADNLECFKLDSSNINFKNELFGIKVALHDIDKQHTIIVYGWVDDIVLKYIDEDEELVYKVNELKEIIPSHEMFNTVTYLRFIECITLHDLLTCSNKYLKERYIFFIEEYNNSIMKKSVLDIINNFNNKDIIDKRSILIMLLIHSNENECHYLAYLLYDLLSNDINGIIDTYEQTLIYDSFPYNIKKYFKDAMKFTLNYPKKISKLENTHLTLEQRICLMKTDDIVKEKAMVKLKEVKMKSEDTGSKAMQYLEGLLKIPFGIYKEEPILSLMPSNITIFKTLVERLNKEFYNNSKCNPKSFFPFKHNYTGLEINKYYPILKNEYTTHIHDYLKTQFKKYIDSISKAKIIDLYAELNELIKIHTEHMNTGNTGNTIKYSYTLTKPSGKSLQQLRECIVNDVNKIITNNAYMLNEMYTFIESSITQHEILIHNELNKQLSIIDTNKNKIQQFMKNVTATLEESVYGHSNAKKQIERIIGQWLNGDLTGYSIGFEGPPGVGKTSLAKKGIANCLKDDNGVSRPFSFIAMGGSTNSSTFDGHNYTYVGSTWGKIVDILMDTKIMNPIIFIDELDKVSKTEHGKEIIGILTHLIDQTQNDTFQDKYFNGINLNLSKALFIFSYNDVDMIDRILLDRIHRVKFDNLSLEDKLIITRQFILPEIYTKMGLNDIIDISDEVVKHIILNYTCEPGVRKLKELIFEIMGGINLDILKNNISENLILPIQITIDNISNTYLKEHRELKPPLIHKESTIGVINGLWANSLGNGGVLPIEVTYYPSNTFLDLKLTGMQGDVMKESMSVAKSLAWSLFLRDTEKEALELQKKLEETKHQGIHIHVPEGATPKDGPSAGTAITIVLYSLFSKRKIKNDIAITGEICLQGRVTAIGGLELKILGGIRAGVKTFIYPSDNKQDYLKFMEKYKLTDIVKGIQFIDVERIEDVLSLVFV